MLLPSRGHHQVRKKVDNEITRWREEAARLQRELKV
jgi:hypothetical protein